MILPDWNSLDSVRRAHSDLELAALAFFALLVVFDVLAHMYEENKDRARLFERIGLWCFAIAVLCEIGAYPYGQRNDALSEQTIGSLDQLAHDAKSTASEAKATGDVAKAEADIAKTTAGNAKLEADTERIQLAALDAERVELERSIADLSEKIKFRHVSPEQADKIKTVLLASAPGSLAIEVRPNADDGDVYCRELWDAIHSGGWTGSFGATTIMYGQAHDLFVIVKDPSHPPPGGDALGSALHNAGIKYFVGRDGSLGTNDLILLVAPKQK